MMMMMSFSPADYRDLRDSAKSRGQARGRPVDFSRFCPFASGARLCRTGFSPGYRSGGEVGGFSPSSRPLATIESLVLAGLDVWIRVTG